MFMLMCHVYVCVYTCTLRHTYTLWGEKEMDNTTKNKVSVSILKDSKISIKKYGNIPLMVTHLY